MGDMVRSDSIAKAAACGGWRRVRQRRNRAGSVWRWRAAFREGKRPGT